MNPPSGETGRPARTQPPAPFLHRAELERMVGLVLDAQRPRWTPARLRRARRVRTAAAVVDHLNALGALPLSEDDGSVATGRTTVYGIGDLEGR